ncbi:hypothetical protein WME90_10455 [Sorangium sp. So ce375]|uniref:hypothetical protein n=1 Tax=Sorangium sp. So ce375 TaxID=3133306 RepID=UPI003F5C3350
MMVATPRTVPVTTEVLECTDAYVVAVWRRIMLLVWRGKATAAGIERSRELFGRWAAGHPGGAVFVVVLPRQDTGPPDEASRAAMQRAASSASRHLRGTATLVESEGFIAASVRSIMTRLYTKRAPNVFRTAAEVAAWAAALLGEPELTPAGVAEAIRVAREG